MKFSRRVTDTPPYLFHLIDEKRKAALERGMDVISLGIGDPDMPTPDFVLDLMNEEMRKPSNHQYPSYKGEFDFCENVAKWFATRFGAQLDPQHEIMATIGAKDAVSHLPFVFIDPGDTALVTDPDTPFMRPQSVLRAALRLGFLSMRNGIFFPTFPPFQMTSHLRPSSCL